MSGECDKCGEHALECICHAENITKLSPFPVECASFIIKKSMQETMVRLSYQCLKQLGLEKEFEKFYLGQMKQNVLEVMVEFSRLHPDKLHVADNTAAYGKCIIIDDRVTPPSVLEYMDEGFSGALELDKRPALLEAVSQLDKGDILLISSRDRIGRDPIVNAMIERAVERKKATLISASGDVSSNNDPASILMKRMVDAFAEYERLIIGARTKAALQVKKRKGQCVGYVPYGYKKCIDNVHIEYDEGEQKVLRHIRECREQGFSYRQIAHGLNITNVPNRKGTKWNHVSITRIMK